MGPEMSLVEDFGHEGGAADGAMMQAGGAVYLWMLNAKGACHRSPHTAHHNRNRLKLHQDSVSG
jgi:hypothetical protein